MTTHDGSGADAQSPVHDAVGAYVLGVLDDADATAFEEHLAGCELCAARLEEFSGMEPMLALLADGPGRFPGSEVSDTDAPGRDRSGRGPYGREASAPATSGDGAGPDGPGTRPGPALHSVPTAGPGSVPGRPRSGDGTAPATPAADGADEPAASVRPSPELLGRLVDEVATRRARRRRRRFYLAAAAAVLIVGGPTAAVVATSGDSTPGAVQAAPANTASAYFKSMTTKYSATDPTTRVSATIALRTKPWGTDAVMELKNVRGPLKCSLVAVTRSGDRQVVTSWAVPEWGYGVSGSPLPAARQPLYVQGGAAAAPKDIDHFDVTTFDGKRLVTVPA
jgi:hypothetical protein